MIKLRSLKENEKGLGQGNIWWCWEGERGGEAIINELEVEGMDRWEVKGKFKGGDWKRFRDDTIFFAKDDGRNWAILHFVLEKLSIGFRAEIN